MQNAYTGQAAPSPLDFVAPDIAVQQRQLQRQQQLAELLRAQALQPTGGTEMVGGWAIPNSPAKPLEKLAQALLARHVQGQADEQETSLAQSRSQALAQALGGLGGGSVDPQQYMTALALDPSGTLAKRMFPEKKYVPVSTNTGGAVRQQVFDPTTGQMVDIGALEVTAKPDTVLTVGSREKVAADDRASREGIAAAGDRTTLAAAGISANTAMRGQDMSAETAKASQALEALKASPEYQAMTATAKAKAEAQAGAQASLPDIVASGERAKKLITELENSPKLEKLVGSGQGALMKLYPGTDAADMQARIDEIKGGAFMQAFQSLKGGGQITEQEGAKATAAITRMSAMQSPAEFKKALTEFREVIDAGMARAKAKAGAPTSTGASGGWSIQPMGN